VTLLDAALGVVIGLVIGSLGGGGSVLTVPLLVFVVGLGAQAATTASLVIVGVTSSVSALGHARAGDTRWRTGVLMALCGVPGAVIGSRLNARLDQDVLLLCFAVLLLVAAAAMLRGSGSQAPSRQGSAAVSSPKVLIAGALVGLLTGLLGVGGGFVVVPVLVVALRLSMSAAVGTSLVVVALNSFVALAARLGGSAPDWAVVVPFAVAAVAASFVGQRIGARVGSQTLTRAFAVMLVLVAVYTALRVIVG